MNSKKQIKLSRNALIERSMSNFMKALTNMEIRDDNNVVYEPLETEEGYVLYTTIGITKSERDTHKKKVWKVWNDKNKEPEEIIQDIEYPNYRYKMPTGYIISNQGDVFSTKSNTKVVWLQLNAQNDEWRAHYNLSDKGKAKVFSYYTLVSIVFNAYATDEAKKLLNESKELKAGFSCDHRNPIIKKAVSNNADIEQRRTRALNCKVSNLQLTTIKMNTALESVHTNEELFKVMNKHGEQNHSPALLYANDETHVIANPRDIPGIEDVTESLNQLGIYNSPELIHVDNKTFKISYVGNDFIRYESELLKISDYKKFYNYLNLKKSPTKDFFIAWVAADSGEMKDIKLFPVK